MKNEKVEPRLEARESTRPGHRALAVLRHLPWPIGTAKGGLGVAANGKKHRRNGTRIDLRHLTPRQMAEVSQELYLSGMLQWEEYAMLAFQPELHPDFDRTIGALTGERADPDRPRDYIARWERRLRFEQKYNRHAPELVARTLRIVNLFRKMEARAGEASPHRALANA